MRHILRNCVIAILSVAMTFSMAPTIANANHRRARHIHYYPLYQFSRVSHSRKKALEMDSQSLAGLRQSLLNPRVDYQLNLSGKQGYRLFTSLASYPQIQKTVREMNPYHQRASLRYLTRLWKDNIYVVHHTRSYSK